MLNGKNQQPIQSINAVLCYFWTAPDLPPMHITVLPSVFNLSMNPEPWRCPPFNPSRWFRPSKNIKSLFPGPSPLSPAPPNQQPPHLPHLPVLRSPTLRTLVVTAARLQATCPSLASSEGETNKPIIVKSKPITLLPGNPWTSCTIFLLLLVLVYIFFWNNFVSTT